MHTPRVFLTGGDGIGWAVDEDLKLTGQALTDTVVFSDLDTCDVVHAVWWEGLMMIPQDMLVGKRIVCHVPGEPFRYLALPAHRHAMAMVGRWITRSSQAVGQLRGIGVESDLVPYVIDTETFRPLRDDDGELTAVRFRWNLPDDTYLIGSFARDTEGSDLQRPKLVKGPDLFLEILIGLKRRGPRFHVVLAGPRRHWLRRQLRQAGIPFTFCGSLTEADDIGINALSRTSLNVLYNLLDLVVVPSRSEGGPHAVLEAAASQCKIISTPVGIAPDVLDPACLYSRPDEAAALIERDIRGHVLDPTGESHYLTALQHHTPGAIRQHFALLYERIDEVPRFRGIRARAGTSTAGGPSVHTQGRVASERRRLTVGLWHSFFKPPYGGGNQFMMALRKGLTMRNVDVRENELHEGIDAHVLNSIHFDVERFLAFRKEHKINVVHRIDGPIHLIRGFDREKDELCYELNAKFASATVLQSTWVYQRIVDMGYRPVNPVIINNAVDPDIFHPRGRVAFDPDRKVRLIATSWSNNPRKGGPTYKWIEEHVDWERFEFTFVGNMSEPCERARHIPPVPSEELADLLRRHDIYITASRNDPCSNALIEALACGLPALYYNDGGHPELVGHGGLPFISDEEIPAQLDKLVEEYESFQKLIVVSRLEDVAGKYLAIIEDVVQ